jgi:hypothetical protein
MFADLGAFVYWHREFTGCPEALAICREHVRSRIIDDAEREYISKLLLERPNAESKPQFRIRTFCKGSCESSKCLAEIIEYDIDGNEIS